MISNCYSSSMQHTLHLYNEKLAANCVFNFKSDMTPSFVLFRLRFDRKIACIKCKHESIQSTRSRQANWEKDENKNCTCIAMNFMLEIPFSMKIKGCITFWLTSIHKTKQKSYYRIIWFGLSAYFLFRFQFPQCPFV